MRTFGLWSASSGRQSAIRRWLRESCRGARLLALHHLGAPPGRHAAGTGALPRREWGARGEAHQQRRGALSRTGRATAGRLPHVHEGQLAGAAVAVAATLALCVGWPCRPGTCVLPQVAVLSPPVGVGLRERVDVNVLNGCTTQGLSNSCVVTAEHSRGISYHPRLKVDTMCKTRNLLKGAMADRKAPIKPYKKQGKRGNVLIADYAEVIEVERTSLR